MFKFANLSKFGDKFPFEVLAQSENVMEVRAMKSNKNPEWVPVINPGQPPPLVLNQESQLWFMAPNPANPVLQVKKVKKGRWYAGGYGYFEPADAPVRFYNYN